MAIIAGKINRSLTNPLSIYLIIVSQILSASLSRFRPKILQTAVTASDSILACLLSTAPSHDRNVSQISEFRANNEADASGVF